MSKGNASQTPVMRQYLDAKAAHPDALMLFRMGDFYELFFEDAVTAARALDLTLTARNKGSDDEIPMAGVPHHAASAYVQRLLEQGFKVAICEQMADPSKVKGLVPREVVRIVSPGIVYDDAGLEARQNHYLVAVDARRPGPVRHRRARSLDRRAPGVRGGRPGERALRARTPRRARGAGGPGGARPREGALRRTRRTGCRAGARGDARRGDGRRSCWRRSWGRARRSDRARRPAARRAAARCIATANASEAGRPLPVSRLVVYTLGDTLVLDEATQAHLELVRSVDGTDRGSLLAQIDATRTAPGARLLRRRLLAPLARVAEIRRRHDAVALFTQHPGTRRELRDALADVGDIERLAVKLALDRAAPRDLVALRRSFATLPQIADTLARCPEPDAREALGVPEGEAWIDACADLHDLLCRAVADEPPARTSDGGVVRDGFDPVLDEARELMRGGQRLIVELEARLRESSGIAGLKLR